MKEIYTPKTFSIPELAGIGKINIEEHLKLYKGYVTNTNLIINKIEEYEKDREGNAYVLGELHRRFAFEFDGMRNHEYYFASFEGGKKEINTNGELYKSIEKEWGSFENWLTQYKGMAMTRGVGWVILYNDKQTGRLMNQWVDEQHLGHLTGLSPVLCLDMWEHAYVYDYPTSEKKKYIEAFFENLNWNAAEKNYEL
ncbi:MAG: Fe-Mn family superoxide dismutase [Candidatus Nomurabacteria bacterium]|nr:Fe-Mn family superoxide dismutase [Candidatus Nomurabacteria bacterium]